MNVQGYLYCRAWPGIIYCANNAKIRQSHFSPQSAGSGTCAGKAKRERLWIDAVYKHKTRRGEHEMKNLIGMLAVLLLASAFVVAQSQDTTSSQSTGQTSGQGSSASSPSSPSSAGQSSSTSSTDQSTTDQSGKKAKKHKKKDSTSSDSSMSGSSSSGTSSGAGSTSGSGSSTQNPPANPPQQ